MLAKILRFACQKRRKTCETQAIRDLALPVQSMGRCLAGATGALLYCLAPGAWADLGLPAQKLKAGPVLGAQSLPKI